MKSNYTVTAKEAVHPSIPYNTVQVTLNSRQFPSSRKTTELLKNICENSSHDIVVHYDFVYIPTKFLMFKPHVQEAIVAEVKSILEFSSDNPKVKGIVFHTDYPFAKSFEYSNDFISDHYKASIWDIDGITRLGCNLDSWKDSLFTFVSRFTEIWRPSMCPLFLENTVKTGGRITIGALSQCITDLGQPFVGLCIDTEHTYASVGVYPSPESIIGLQEKFPIMVHLNTIPSEVNPMSFKDRHSLTTLQECSLNSLQFYQEYIEALESHNILYIREVKEETITREQQQLQSTCPIQYQL